MDIYSAQSHINKLLAYIKELHSSNRRMYSKSKTKLKDLSDTCVSIVDMISDILEDEMFTESYDEFSGLDYKEIQGIKAHMGDTLLNMPKPVPVDNFTAKDRKKAFAQYVTVLDEVAHKDIPSNRVDNCAKIIWYWFEHRFMLTNNFRYSMKQLPIWIQFLVMSYGYSICQGQDSLFIEEMRQWCDKLLLSDVPYPFPYEIYDKYKNPSKSFANLTSVVMWDILLSSGYDKLCKGHPKELYFREDAVYNYCGKLNPSELDRYVHYSSDDTILSICNLQEGTI